ncbi:MAG: hypothetical protein COB41_05555 [Proteobacteria bacterium]|nr:MAG: hypothetical protein COB41_05555 [Pseudomonadota bacterium]
MSVTKDYYIYNAVVSTLAAGATQTEVINIEADANFIVQKMAYYATLGTATPTNDDKIVPLIGISILDSGSGRNLQDQAVPLSSLAGTGALPFVLPIPRLFKARSSINIKFNNFSTLDEYTNITLSLIGHKIFS